METGCHSSEPLRERSLAWSTIEEVFEEMKPDDIRAIVQDMWLTTPEMELLACIAVALAEIWESVTGYRAITQSCGSNPEAERERGVPSQ